MLSVRRPNNTINSHMLSSEVDRLGRFLGSSPRTTRYDMPVGHSLWRHCSTEFEPTQLLSLVLALNPFTLCMFHLGEPSRSELGLFESFVSFVNNQGLGLLGMAGDDLA